MKTIANIDTIKLFDSGLTEEYEAIKQDSNYEYMTSVTSSFALNIASSGLVTKIWGASEKAERKTTLVAETGIQVVPNYVISVLMVFNNFNAPSELIPMLSRINDEETIGVPIFRHGYLSGSTADRFKTTLKNSIFKNKDLVHLQATTITKKHLSEHDIAHMICCMATGGVFPISKYKQLVDNIEKTKSINEFTSLFAVLSALYKTILEGTSLPRSCSRIHQMADYVRDYLQKTKTTSVRIMSDKDDARLPDEFTL